MTVAFFGHSNTPSDVYPLIERKIAELAEKNTDLTFYVGTHGAFDGMAQRALKEAAERYPHIRAYIVLAYYDPTAVKEEWEQYELPTIFPEGIELVHKKWAIEYRNKFMVNECDAVVCYIRHDWGGAAKFVHKAERQGKNIINLAETHNIKEST